MIAYGLARNNRSCASCVYKTIHAVKGTWCQLEDEKTSVTMVCGLWLPDTRAPTVIELQNDLFGE